MDPGDVPAYLPNLTEIEEMMIFKVVTIVRVYKIRGNQTGYSGHVTNFPQGIAAFARKLARVPSDIPANIVVAKRGTAQHFAEFNVNGQVLKI